MHVLSRVSGALPTQSHAMRTFLCTIFLSISLLLSVSVGWKSLHAGDELTLRSEQQATEKLLVLLNGRVVSGQLSPRVGGYDVVLPAGRMFVSSKQIRFQADNMDDAYLRMRETLPEFTPNTHLELARWCLANNLPSRARREALDALHLDPHQADAQRMLEALVREENRIQRVSHTSITAEQLQRHQIEQRVAPERRSLGGLPETSAREFTHRILPLVSNKCGNSQCHGAGRNTFSILTLRRDPSPAAAEQNLASILNHIDFQNPAQSPVLRATMGNHGGSNQPLFSGQTGGRQAETIRNWVLTVANELAPTESTRHSNAFAASALNLPGGSKDADAASENVESNDGEAFGEHDLSDSERLLDEKFVGDAVISTRHDEFDPDIFNRRYHGKSRSDLKLDQLNRRDSSAPILGTP